MPTREDIGKAYKTYYTHEQPEGAKATGSNGLYRSIRRAMYKPLLRILRVRKERKRLKCMYLDRMPPGRLLEVGCGAGKRLVRLRALGWQVLGQEVDPAAAAHARRRWNVEVHLGSLETLPCPGETFDAVVMNHVIEHVHQPVALLSTCHRLLRPGGKLVAVTPNAASYGHRKFGAFWHGLDPPRHLHVFTCRTLMAISERAGFSDRRCWTTAANAEGVGRGSRPPTRMSADHRRIITTRDRLRGMAFQLGAILAFLGRKSSGEECVIVATK